jgi:phosphate:Na+ symporter
MGQIIITILAGLGLFLVGVRFVRQNISKITSRRLKKLIEKGTNNTFLTSLWGAIFGAFALSTSAITYTTVSFTSTGLINVRKAFPLIAWSNPGSCLLFVIAFLDIRLFFLLLIGITGISLALEKPRKYQNTVYALFGLGLIFYGVNLMSEGAAPIASLEWFSTLIVSSKNYYLLLFVVASVLAFLVQSTDGFLIIILTLTKLGIITIEQTMILIYATTIGDSLLNWVLSLSFKGTAKQIAMFQVLFNVIGVCIFLPLFFIEEYFNVPLIKYLFTSIDIRVEQQMIYLLIFFNVTVALLLTLFSDPAYKIIERLWPQTDEEDESSLKFINERALHDPSSAVILIEKEQMRLVNRLPKYTNWLHNVWDNNQDNFSLETTHQSFIKLSSEVDYFVSEMVNTNADKETSQRIISLVNKQNVILSLEDNIHQLILLISKTSWTDDMSKLTHSIIEAFDTILLVSVDALESAAADDFQMLFEITKNKGDMMDGLRNRYLNAQEKLDANERQMLLFITEHFERNVWLVRKLATLFQNRTI